MEESILNYQLRSLLRYTFSPIVLIPDKNMIVGLSIGNIR